MDSSSIQDIFFSEKVAGIIRAKNFDDAKSKFTLLQEGGLKLIEISYDPKFFGEIVVWAKAHFPKVKVGAASLLNVDQARESIKLGVDFLVSPVSNINMIEYALANNKEIIPGAFSPSEISNIMQNFPSLDFVKLFPADSPSYFQNLTKVFPQVNFLISSFNIHEVQTFINKGARAFVIGSYFTDDVNLTVQRVKNILNVLQNQSVVSY